MDPVTSQEASNETNRMGSVVAVAMVEDVWRAFRLMDRDQNGSVSASELRIGLYALGLRLPNDEDAPAELRNAFALRGSTEKGSGGSSASSSSSTASPSSSGQLDFDAFLEFVATADTEAAETIKASLLGGVRA